MTETPGTPAYMPPEVMVADPHYNTSVDVFSFGVMMIHTFTAEWPLPKVGPTRINPANPNGLIPVTEAERREEFLLMIIPDHPLMDLIMRCLSNNPQQRPTAAEIVSRMVGVVLEHPPSFENRVDMLQRVSTLLTEKRELEEEVVRKDSAIEEKAKEIGEKAKEIGEKAREIEVLAEEVVRKDSAIEEKAREIEVLAEEVVRKDSAIEEKAREIEVLAEEVVRKDSAIQEKAGENEALAEEKRRQEKKSGSTAERMQLVHSLETDQFKLEIEDLKGQLEDKETTDNTKDAFILSKDARITEIETRCKQLTEEVEQHIANFNYSQNELVSKTTKIDQLETNLEQEQSNKNSTIAHKDSIIASKDTHLQKNATTIRSLNDQLTKTRGYLTSKPHSLQVRVSYSQCSGTPVAMSGGLAVTINGKVYYGGGDCDDDDGNYSVHCYDPPQNVWSTLPRLPVRWFGLGEVNGELVAVGGRDSSRSKSNVVRVFNKGRNWKRTIPPMPTARSSLTVVSLPTHLIVAGGEVGYGYYTDNVEIYNIGTFQWSETDRLPYACCYQIGIVYMNNNTVYLVGGYDGKNLNKVFAAQINKLTSADRQDDGSANKADSIWNTISDTPFYRPSPVTISNTIFAAGGLITNKATQRMYAYSSSMDSWLYVGDLPYPVAFATTVSLSTTECLVIGGWNKTKLSTVYRISITTTVS